MKDILLLILVICVVAFIKLVKAKARKVAEQVPDVFEENEQKSGVDEVLKGLFEVQNDKNEKDFAIREEKKSANLSAIQKINKEENAINNSNIKDKEESQEREFCLKDAVIYSAIL